MTWRRRFRLRLRGLLRAVFGPYNRYIHGDSALSSGGVSWDDEANFQAHQTVLHVEIPVNNESLRDCNNPQAVSNIVGDEARRVAWDATYSRLVHG